MPVNPCAGHYRVLKETTEDKIRGLTIPSLLTLLTTYNIMEINSEALSALSIADLTSLYNYIIDNNDLRVSDDGMSRRLPSQELTEVLLAIEAELKKRENNLFII